MTFLGWLSDPFKGLSDLQLGDEKVTLNHLAIVGYFGAAGQQDEVLIASYETFRNHAREV